MSNLFSLKDKAAIVTGASSGLGVQFAKALARQGANLAIVARRSERLNEVKAEIEALGVQCLALKCDVTNSSEITETVNKVIADFGKIDILVNNAGIAFYAPAEIQSDEMWKRIMDVNLNGAYFFAREAGKHMVENRYGKIINIGSIHSNVAMTGLPLSAYCTTKGAILMMTRALAAEWAKYNITVNAIGPAYFESDMTAEVIHDASFKELVKTYCPMGRIGRQGELDGALIYFASDASSYTTGQILSIDGGWTAI